MARKKRREKRQKARRAAPRGPGAERRKIEPLRREPDRPDLLNNLAAALTLQGRDAEVARVNRLGLWDRLLGK